MNSNQYCILVTGGAKNIGKLITKNLLDQGYNIILHVNESYKSALELTNSYPSNKIALFQANLDKTDNYQNYTNISKKHNWIIKGIINNASIYNRDEYLNVTEENLDKNIAINFKAPFFICQEYIKYLSEIKDYNSEYNNLDYFIINLIDCAIWKTNIQHRCSYLLSKKLLANLHDILSLEAGIYCRVNAISPGKIIRTNQTKTESLLQREQNLPIQKLSTELDIISAINLIINHPWLHGNIINVDSGESKMKF